MQKTNEPILSSGSIPDNYQEILYWKVTEKRSRVIALNILGVLLFVVFGLVFFNLAIRVGKMPLKGEYDLRETSLAFAGVILTFVFHELTHGFVMRIFGAKPRYGILWKGMMFYATAPGYAYPRNKYLAILLAPLVCISILVILGMWVSQGTLWGAFLGICATVNASGAIGDMCMTGIVLRYPTEAYIMDDRDGMRVSLPKS